jgi:glycosyltransferase involved in cell wall biosynthesis
MGGGRDGAAVKLALWAQRRAHLAPAPVRAAASGLMRRLGRSRTGMVEPLGDWTVPLVLGRPGGDIEALRPSAVNGSVPAARGPSVPTGPRLRCVVATGMLDVGGAEEFVAFLAHGLPRYGLDTTVVYSDTRLPGQPGEGGRVARALAAAGVSTVELSGATAADWFRANRPDVISTHYAPGWLLDAALDAGVPWVETLHDGMHSFHNRETIADERRRAPRMYAQVAVSDLVRRQYLARDPEFPADRFVTVPNGVDPARVALVDRARVRAALGLTDEFLFLCLARYSVQKNGYGLVTAFAEVAREHPKAHLLMAGRADDAVYFTQTRQLAESLPCADRIHLRSHCANPAGLLVAADAFVLDSFFEGWSLASMEALASGTPVVLSEVGGAREQVTGGDEECGYLVANPGGPAELVDWPRISAQRFQPQENRAAFAAAMSTMVRERHHWAVRRERLRAGSLARFSADICLGRHAGVLRAAALGEPVPDYSAGAGVTAVG